MFSKSASIHLSTGKILSTVSQDGEDLIGWPSLMTRSFVIVPEEVASWLGSSIKHWRSAAIYFVPSAKVWSLNQTAITRSIVDVMMQSDHGQFDLAQHSVKMSFIRRMAGVCNLISKRQKAILCACKKCIKSDTKGRRFFMTVNLPCLPAWLHLHKNRVNWTYFNCKGRWTSCYLKQRGREYQVRFCVLKWNPGCWPIR